MSEPVIDIHADAGAESIPAVLAAPKPKRFKAAKADLAVSQPVADAPAAEPVSAPTAAAPADPVQKEVTVTDTTINTAADTAHTATETASQGAQALFGDMTGRAKDAMGKSAAMFAELNSFNKGNIEAMVESGRIAFTGMQTLAQNQASFLRKQVEEATAAAKSMATVKSPTEFVKLQGEFVRQQFDGMVAETSRSTETMLKLAGEVVQPISNRFALAAEKVRVAA
jgi:phasin family protein